MPPSEAEFGDAQNDVGFSPAIQNLLQRRPEITKLE